MKPLRYTKRLFKYLGKISGKVLFDPPHTFVICSADKGMLAVWKSKLSYHKQFILSDVKGLSLLIGQMSVITIDEKSIFGGGVSLGFLDPFAFYKKEFKNYREFYELPETSCFSITSFEHTDILKCIRVAKGENYIQFTKSGQQPVCVHIFNCPYRNLYIQQKLEQEDVNDFVFTIRGDYFKKLIPDDYEVVVRGSHIELISVNFDVAYLFKDEDKFRFDEAEFRKLALI